LRTCRGDLLHVRRDFRQLDAELRHERRVRIELRLARGWITGAGHCPDDLGDAFGHPAGAFAKQQGRQAVLPLLSAKAVLHAPACIVSGSPSAHSSG